jgi:chorismate-pyruvate lyase
MVSEQFSIRLLDHDRLMTPVLKRQFGDICAVQSAADESDDTYRRVAALYRREDAVLLLEAALEIPKSALPAAIFEALRTTDRPFGQLLIDRGIDGVSVGRTLFSAGAPGSPDRRWGRRHSIVELRSGQLLCRVEELLVPERHLLAARQKRKEPTHEND